MYREPSPQFRQVSRAAEGQMSFLMRKLFRAEVGKLWTSSQIWPLVARFWATTKNGFHIVKRLEKTEKDLQCMKTV